MFASAYVQNGATVYIASRKEKQLKEVRFLSYSFLLPRAQHDIGVRCSEQERPRTLPLRYCRRLCAYFIPSTTLLVLQLTHA